MTVEVINAKKHLHMKSEEALSHKTISGRCSYKSTREIKIVRANKCTANAVHDFDSHAGIGPCHPRSWMKQCVLPISASDSGPQHDANGASH